MNLPTDTIALGLRAALLAFTFCLFICSCVALGKLDFWHGRTGVSLVTSLLGFIYYIPTVLPPVARLLSPATALAGDAWMFIWWIIAVGVLGDRFGDDLSCDWFSNSSKTGCHAGKAGLAFAVLGFVTSIATLVIIGYFSFYKSYKANGKAGILQKGTLSSGAIFLNDSSEPLAPTQNADVEAVGASSGQEDAVDQKDVDSQPTEHSPAGSRHSQDLATK